jgi:hypothetical protein
VSASASTSGPCPGVTVRSETVRTGFPSTPGSPPRSGHRRSPGRVEVCRVRRGRSRRVRGRPPCGRIARSGSAVRPARSRAPGVPWRECIGG